jgi:hypothetical protein
MTTVHRHVCGHHVYVRFVAWRELETQLMKFTICAQGRPLHCSGFNPDDADVSTSCEIYNVFTQKYDAFPSLPIDPFNANQFAFQLVRAVHKHAAHVYSRTLTRCLLSSTPPSDGFVCIASLHSSNLACMQVILNTGTLVAAVKPDNTNHQRTRTFIFTSGATSWLEVEPEVRQGGQTNWPVRWRLTRWQAAGDLALLDSWEHKWSGTELCWHYRCLWTL